MIFFFGARWFCEVFWQGYLDIFYSIKYNLTKKYKNTLNNIELNNAHFWHPTCKVQIIKSGTILFMMTCYFIISFYLISCSLFVQMQHFCGIKQGNCDLMYHKTCTLRVPCNKTANCMYHVIITYYLKV